MATRFLAHSWHRLQFAFRLPSTGFLGEIMSSSPEKSASLATNHHAHVLSDIYNKRLLKTHIIGIMAHKDLRKTSRSPCRAGFQKHPLDTISSRIMHCRIGSSRESANLAENLSGAPVSSLPLRRL